MATQIIRPRDRQEWLQYRKDGIGSSEVATIVGLNPWDTPYRLWRRKRGMDAPKEENFAMKAGHYLEDAVSKFWADETGCEVIKSSAGDWLIVNPDKPYLRVSPDRTYWLKGCAHNAQNKGILECKTTQKTIDENDIPKYWFCQVQYQLGVAELTEGSLAWLSCGRDFGYRNLSFVPDFYGWLEEEVEKFYFDCVKNGKEPAMIDAQDVLTKYTTHVGGKITEVTEEVYNAYKELKEVKKQLAELDKQKEELEERLKVGFADAEAISYCGATLATWKAPKPSNRFDEKAFRAENPDLADKYMHEVQGARRFLLK